VTALHGFEKSRSGRAFAQQTRRAYDTMQRHNWTASHLFDVALIDEITSYVRYYI
jgi:hypothetical protein